MPRKHRIAPQKVLFSALFTSMLALLVTTYSVYADEKIARIEPKNQLPTIGEPADRYLSPAQELKLGADFLRNVYRSGAVLEDPEVSDYVQYLGDKLANSLGHDNFDFTFFVVNDPGINAFAVPGGFIGVNAGLILTSKTESELAGVLAHEIAHVSQRHIARRIAAISSKQAPTLGAILAGILLAASGSSDAGQALVFAGQAALQQQSLNFTRSNETEADRIGLRILYKSGFDPNGMSSFFQSLQRKRAGRIPDQYEYLLTHPLDNTRISEAKNRIDQLPTQIHKSSLNYHLAKSRLQAIINKNPKKLAREIEKNREKNTGNLTDDYAYAQALEQNDQNKKALQLIKPLLVADDENIAYQLAHVRLKNNLNQHKASEKILEKMFKLYPDDFSVNYYYADTLKSLEKAPQGRDLLKGYLRSNPSPTVNVYKLLAELYEDSGDQVNSKQTLAEYYFNTGNYNAAIFQLRNALSNPDVDFVTRSQIEKRLREMLTITRS